MLEIVRHFELMRNPESMWSEEVEKQIQSEFAKHDNLFNSFAERLGADLIRDYHGNPSRIVAVLGEIDQITRSIQFVAVLKNPDVFPRDESWKISMSCSAWKDTPTKRKYWSQNIALLDDLNLPEKEIQGLLDVSWKRLSEIGERDLSRSDALV